MLIKIETQNAPKAVGPYSQAVRSGNLLFVSGQIPLNPQTNRIEETTIEGQTRQVFTNIRAILTAAGCTLDDVIRVEVYLKDLQDFGTLNQIYSEYFTADVKPARQTLQVARLPLDALVEISCISELKI